MSYRLLRWLFRAALGGFYRRVHVDGLERIPTHGPVLIVSNHCNGFVDAFLVLTRLRRPVTLTAKAALAELPPLRWLLRGLGAVLLHRRQRGEPASAGADNARALASLGDVLDAGGVVHLFPEGKSHPDARLRPFRSGAARLALGYRRRHGETSVADPSRDAPHAAGELTLLPLAVHYPRMQRWRSEAYLRVGEPLPSSAWPARDGETDARALSASLRERVHELRQSLRHDVERASAVRDRERHGGEHHGPRRRTTCPASAPLALWGATQHLPAFLLGRRLVRTLSRDADHVATHAILLGAPLVVAFGLLQSLLVGLLLSPLWGALYAASLLPGARAALRRRDSRSRDASARPSTRTASTDPASAHDERRR